MEPAVILEMAKCLQKTNRSCLILDQIFFSFFFLHYTSALILENLRTRSQNQMFFRIQ